MIHQYDEFVNFANILADESAQIIGEYFRKKININNKKDDSPVTIADLPKSFILIWQSG